MSEVDVSQLLAPIAPDDPCGPDIGAAVDYVVLQQEYYALAAADGEADPNGWRRVARQSESMLSQSKDVWLAVFLTNALLRTHGLLGLREGLTLLAGLLEQYWDAVHPRKDVEDDYPIQRVNAVADLNAFPFLRAVRQCPLVNSREHGVVTLRDMLLAHGDIPLPEGSTEAKPDPERLDGILREIAVRDSAQLEVLLRCLEDCSVRLNTIVSVQKEHVGADAELLADLTQLLKRAADFAQAASGGVATPPIVDPPSPNGGATVSSPPATPAEVRSRDDVIRAIDRICKFYQEQEPTSPVPLLLGRAKRLVRMNFLEVVQELAPESLDAMNKLGGVNSAAANGGG